MGYKERAAEALRLSANDLLENKVIDRIIKEPVGGAHRLPHEMFTNLGLVLIEELDRLQGQSLESMLQARRQKFYSMGVWAE